MKNKTAAATTVETMDFPKFLLDLVAKRNIVTSDSSPGKVLAKLDIEGYEHTLLPNLFMTTAICALDKIFMEIHTFGRIYKEVRDVSAQNLVSFFRYMTHASKVRSLALQSQH